MTDLRSVHFHEIRETITGKRLEVWEAMLSAGPCTGSELAARMGWTVLSVRPRLTELCDAFHVVATGERRDGEHVFKAVTAAEAMKLHEAARHSYVLEERRQERETVSQAASILAGARGKKVVEQQPELALV